MENAGQTVPHFHSDVVPRKSGDWGIFEPTGVFIPQIRAVSPSEELHETAEPMRNNYETCCS